MSESSLTAGAERLLDAVQREVDSSVGFNALLLSAMLRDEGRATELLRVAGVSEDRLQGLPAAAPADFSPWRQVLVRVADRFAIELSSQQFTGTEHLLLAAMQLEPAILALLTEYGLTITSISERVVEEVPDLSDAGEPLLHIQAAGPGTMDQAALFRILDASGNRCREGLRVVEDAVRFQLDDALLSRELKEIRHLLTTTLRQLGQAQWISSRDVTHDVGARSDLASERDRGSLLDVLRAAMKRVEESLRSLEEYSKLIDADLSSRITGCRYRFYNVERALETSLQSRQRLQDCRLYLLVTDALCRYGAERTIRDTLGAGVDVVQIREKEMPDRQLLSWVRQVRRWTHEAGKLLIVNDRADVAATAGADGVHLGQDDLDVVSARKILGGTGLIGVSTHALPQVREAVFAGADYLGIGPVFTSRTKEFTEFAGLEYVREATRESSLPAFAIGGITAENVGLVREAGSGRIAVSSAICQAPHPTHAAEQLAAALRLEPVVSGSE